MSLLRPNHIAMLRSGLGTLSCQVATGHRLAAVRAVRWQSTSSACNNVGTCAKKRCLLTSANDTTGTLTKQLAQTNALLEPVVEREKASNTEQGKSTSSAQVVGGKGSEGNHFKRRLHDSSRSHIIEHQAKLELFTAPHRDRIGHPCARPAKSDTHWTVDHQSSSLYARGKSEGSFRSHSIRDYRLT